MTEKIRLRTLFTVGEIANATDVGFREMIQEAKENVEKQLSELRQAILLAIQEVKKQRDKSIVKEK